MNPNPYSYCNVEGQTDVGCVRKANEDWLDSFECNNGLVAVVCDGMGGHVGGQVASHIAVDTIRQFLSTNYFDQPQLAIIESINAANAAILQRASQQPELTGMGSTCVMLIVRDGKVYIGSVGDSRVYLVRSKMIRQLTKDQSYVQTLVDSGQITPEQAEHHPRKNEITNALGLPNMAPATVLSDSIIPEAGDCFILCSDGLSGMVPDAKIARVASDQANLRQAERVSKLIEMARQNGGVDNITCQFVEFSVSPNSKDEPDNKKKLIRYGFFGAIAVCVIAAICYFIFKPGPSKDEVYEDELRANNGWVVGTPQDTLLFAPGDTILVVNPIPKYRVVEIYAWNYKNEVDTLIIPRPFSVDSMAVSHDSTMLTTHRDGGRGVIAFKDHFVGQFIHITFTQGDSTFTYKYYVQMPVPEVPAPVATTTSTATTPTKPSNNNGQVLVDIASNRTTPINVRDITFDLLPFGTQTFELSNAVGTNSKSIAYFPKFTFEKCISHVVEDAFKVEFGKGSYKIVVEKPDKVSSGPVVKVEATDSAGAKVIIKVRFKLKK